MPLLISDSDQIVIDVWHDNGNILKMSDHPTDGFSKETFSFKRPSWGTLSKIMAESMVLLPSGGVTINPVIYTDLKVRVLLSSWSLRDSGGKPIPLNIENMSRLNPDLWSFLGDKLDAHITKLKEVNEEEPVPSVPVAKQE